MDISLFPYYVRVIGEQHWWMPTSVDYMNKQLWHQRSQVSGDGEWIDFDDVEFKHNPKFKLDGKILN